MKHTLKGNTLTVWLEGELDHHCAVDVRAQLEEWLGDPSIKYLVLNLKKLTFMDSSGIGVVIGRYKTLSRRGGDVVIEHAYGNVDRIFAMSGLYQIVKKR